MAIQRLETIKNWFRTNLKPTQQQFWDTWDSFRHKDEKIKAEEIEGIENLTPNIKEVLTKGHTYYTNGQNDYMTFTNQYAPGWQFNSMQFMPGGIRIEKSHRGNTDGIVYGGDHLGSIFSRIDHANEVGFRLSTEGLLLKTNVSPDGTGIIKSDNLVKTTDYQLPVETAEASITLVSKVNGIPADVNGNVIVDAGGSQNLEKTLENGNTTSSNIVFSNNGYKTIINASDISINETTVGTTSIQPSNIQLLNPNGNVRAILKGDGLGLYDESGANSSRLIYNSESTHSGDFKFPLQKNYSDAKTLAITDDITFQKVLNNGENNGATGTVPGGYAGILTGIFPYQKSVIFSLNSKDYTTSGGFSLSNGAFSLGASLPNYSSYISFSDGRLVIQQGVGNFTSRIQFADPMSDNTFLFPAPEQTGSYTIAMTSDFAADNYTKIPLSATNLNSTYPNVINGFKVHCQFISGTPLIYEKTNSGWIQYPIMEVTP